MLCGLRGLASSLAPKPLLPVFGVFTNGLKGGPVREVGRGWAGTGRHQGSPGVAWDTDRPEQRGDSAAAEEPSWASCPEQRRDVPGPWRTFPSPGDRSSSASQRQERSRTLPQGHHHSTSSSHYRKLCHLRVRLRLDTDSWWQTEQTEARALWTSGERRAQEAPRVSPACWGLEGSGESAAAGCLPAGEEAWKEAWRRAWKEAWKEAWRRAGGEGEGSRTARGEAPRPKAKQRGSLRDENAL